MAAAFVNIEHAGQTDPGNPQSTLYTLTNSREPWIAGMLDLADKLLQSPTQVEKPELTTSDFGWCKAAGRAHIELWDVRTSGEQWQQSLMGSYENLIRKNHHLQFRFHSKTKNKIRNISADTFAGRTSIPHYFTESCAYPPQSPIDKAVCSKITDAEIKFHPPKATKQLKVGDNWRHVSNYLDISGPIRLLKASHVLDAGNFLSTKEVGSTAANTAPISNDAATVFKSVWPHGWVNKLVASAPPLRTPLGRDLHFLSENEAAILLVTVSLYGVRFGVMGWRRFSNVLVQGGWPWLNGYTKAFAKAVYIALICLLSGLEQGVITEGAATGVLMIELAKLLIGGRERRGLKGLRLRIDDRLKGSKIKVYGIKAPGVAGEKKEQAANPPQHAHGQITLNKEASRSTFSLRLKSKKSQASLVAVKELHPSTSENSVDNSDPTAAAQTENPKTEAVRGWTLSNTAMATDIPPTPPKAGPHPVYILCSEKCNHGDNLPFSGRVKVAHCLSELEKQLDDNSGITVAQTLGQEDAREEVIDYVSEGKILTVLRVEGQCIYCAYRMAHFAGALVVIG